MSRASNRTPGKIRTGWLVAGVFLAILAVGFPFAFERTKDHLRQKVEQILLKQESRGMHFTWNDLSLSGMPWNMSLNIHGLNARFDPVPGLVAKSIGVVQVSLAPAFLMDERIIFQGDCLEIHVNSEQDPLIRAKGVKGEFSVGEPQRNYRLEFVHTDFSGIIQGLLSVQLLRVAQIPVQLEQGSEKSQDGFLLELEDIKGNFPTGHIRQIMAEMVFSGPFQGDSLKNMVKGWNETSGSVDIPRFLIEAGQFKATGGGTFTLDENLQPLATLTTQVSGLGETITDLTDHGVIKRATANLLRAGLALALMSTRRQDLNLGARGKDRDSDKERQTLNLSFTLQEGAISTGFIKIADFPRIDWSSHAWSRFWPFGSHAE